MGRSIELGCGMRPTPGYDLYHDRILHSAHVTVAWDLRVVPWPWAEGEFDRVLALDVFEHVSADIPVWLDELHRILCCGGLAELRLPCWDNPNSYRDPTHVRLYHKDTFCYWDPDHELHREFGSIYFAESGKWWKVESTEREFGDWRYKLRKRPFSS